MLPCSLLACHSARRGRSHTDTPTGKEVGLSPKQPPLPVPQDLDDFIFRWEADMPSVSER